MSDKPKPIFSEEMIKYQEAIVVCLELSKKGKTGQYKCGKCKFKDTEFCLMTHRAEYEPINIGKQMLSAMHQANKQQEEIKKLKKDLKEMSEELV